MINALASASDLKTTPPTDKEPPLADRKKTRYVGRLPVCIIYVFPFDDDDGHRAGFRISEGMGAAQL